MGHCFSMFKKAADVNEDGVFDFKDVKIAGELVYTCLLNGSTLIGAYKPLFVLAGVDGEKFDAAMTAFNTSIQSAHGLLQELEELGVSKIIEALKNNPGDINGDNKTDINDGIAYAQLIKKTIDDAITLCTKMGKDASKLSDASKSINDVIEAAKQVKQNQEAGTGRLMKAM